MTPTVPKALSTWRGPRVGFFAWLIGLVALLVLLPFGMAWAGFGSVSGLLPSSVLTAVLLLSFLPRPKETILAFCLFILFYETVALWTLEGIKRVDELAVPAMFAVTLVRVRPWRRPLLQPLRDIPIAAAAMLGVVSSVVQAVPASVWLPALLLLSKGILFFYTVSWLDFHGQDLRRYARATLAVAVAVVLLGMVELLNPAAFQQALHLREVEQVRGGITSVKSIFFHPVLFAWFSVFVSLYCYAYFTIFRRWWMLALALLLSIGAILSGRRKAIVGAVAAMGVGVVSQFVAGASWRQLARGWVPIAGGLVMLTLIFLPYFRDMSESTLDRYLPPDAPIVATTPPPVTDPGEVPPERIYPKSTPPRIALYLGSVDVAVDHFPLGGGLGRWGSWMSRVEFSPLYERYGLTAIPGLRPRNSAAATDTFWPQLLGELGVFGIASYLVFITVLLVTVWRAAARAGGAAFRAFCFGTLLAFVEALVESIAAPMFAAPSATYFVLGAVAVVVSLARRLDFAEPDPPVESQLAAAR